MTEFAGQLKEMKGQQTIKCLQCVTEYLQANKKMPNALPPINDAVTWAPQWLNQIIQGQFMVACTSVPCCMEHIETHEKSAEQIAIEGGIILGGGGMP